MSFHPARTIAVILALFLTGCASISKIELPKVQQEFTRAMQNSGDVVGKAQADFTEKTRLYENLKAANSAGFREIAKDLKRRLGLMKASLNTMEQQRKHMSEANSHIAALAYSRKDVRVHEPEYEAVDQAIKQFEAATLAVNNAVADYSRESNSLADVVTAKKLYFNFDVAEFQNRLKKNLTTAQSNQRDMQRELDRSEAVVNNTAGGGDRDQQLKIYNEMNRLAQEYSDKAQRYSELSKEMHTKTMGSARVSSLDSHWPSIQVLVTEFEVLIKDLARLNDDFLVQAKRFRNPPKSEP